MYYRHRLFYILSCARIAKSPNVRCTIALFDVAMTKAAPRSVFKPGIVSLYKRRRTGATPITGLIAYGRAVCCNICVGTISNAVTTEATVPPEIPPFTSCEVNDSAGERYSPDAVGPRDLSVLLAR